MINVEKTSLMDRILIDKASGFFSRAVTFASGQNQRALMPYLNDLLRAEDSGTGLNNKILLSRAWHDIFEGVVHGY